MCSRGAMGMIARAELFVISLYRKFVSPLKKGPTCRFVPTCSEYAFEAIRLHGALKGTYLAVRRVLRCHPFCKGGYDPVPR
ncbi:MAG: membrane protein insertion efficiency factor YidD [Firmicutes bacterium]|nr:membrane protein insertion efficiency factor YidD [Bacillota bacterium]